MLSLSPYFSARAFIAVKSLTVVPHREATLRISVGLPAKDLKSTLEPSILLAEKSMSVDMLTAARAATPREEMPTLKAEPSVCASTSIGSRRPKVDRRMFRGLPRSRWTQGRQPGLSGVA